MKLLNFASPSAEDPDSHTMPLLEHLMELRTRILISIATLAVATIGCFFVATPIFNWLTVPLYKAMAETGGVHPMIFTEVTEYFFTQIKVALFAGIVITFPVIATQMWRFVAPGLYKHEKHAFLPFLIASPILFLIGAATVYYVIMPRAWTFFLGFQTAGGEGIPPIELQAKVGEYLDICIHLMLAFGLAFQFPVLLILLARVGILTSTWLREKRRYAIVGVFAFSALVTPPDAGSMIMLAIPMMLMYEISIFGARWVEKRREQSNADIEAAAGIEDTDFNQA